jgi:hypothetical protein
MSGCGQQRNDSGIAQPVQIHDLELEGTTLVSPKRRKPAPPSSTGARLRSRAGAWRAGDRSGPRGPCSSSMGTARRPSQEWGSAVAPLAHNRPTIVRSGAGTCIAFTDVRRSMRHR